MRLDYRIEALLCITKREVGEISTDGKRARAHEQSRSIMRDKVHVLLSFLTFRLFPVEPMGLRPLDENAEL